MYEPFHEYRGRYLITSSYMATAGTHRHIDTTTHTHIVKEEPQSHGIDATHGQDSSDQQDGLLLPAQDSRTISMVALVTMLPSPMG